MAKKGLKEPMVPVRASTPMAVRTWERRARWWASWMARAATAVETAVPFRIARASLGPKVMIWRASASSAVSELTRQRLPLPSSVQT